MKEAITCYHKLALFEWNTKEDTSESCSYQVTLVSQSASQLEIPLKINQNIKNLKMEVGLIKHTETRNDHNDGITVRKFLLWHLLQHSSVKCCKLLNAKVGIFSLLQ